MGSGRVAARIRLSMRAVLENQGGRMRGHVTLCYMVVGGNLNWPLNLFILFAKALMEQGFRSDLFLAKDTLPDQWI